MPFHDVPIDLRTYGSGYRRRAAHRSHTVFAREHPSSYDAGSVGDPDGPPRPPHPAHARDADLYAPPPERPRTDGAADVSGPTADDQTADDQTADDLDSAVGRVRAAIADLLRKAADPGAAGGELSALLGLLTALDAGHAAAIELTDTSLRRSSAQRSAGLPLEALLAMESRQTYGDRRALLRVTETLRAMPHLRAAWHAGMLGWGQIVAITSEAATLPAAARAELDARFTDTHRLAGFDPDHLIDTVRETAASLRPDVERTRELRQIEQRFHHVQPQLDGGVTGYYELDSEAGAIWLEALQSASPAPTGARDATRDAIDAAVDGDVDQARASNEPGDLPAFADPVPGPTRARQRADGMIALAESWLAGTRADGSPRRARTRTYVWTDIDRLTGNDSGARAARLLWATIGAPATLTAEAASRLTSDTDLQLIIHRDGEVIGVCEPTASIPARVRAAVHARDRGCRFPGCRAPIHWTDLHHVIAREDGGPTTVANLVALCRRHHTVVTNRAWCLTMTPDGTVTVTRGSRIATSDPPHRRILTTG